MGTEEESSQYGQIKVQVQEIRKSMESIWNQLQKLKEDYNNNIINNNQSYQL